jgi:sulfite exporter TauE/SafE
MVVSTRSDSMTPHPNPSPKPAGTPTARLRTALAILLILGAIVILLNLDALLGGHSELPTGGEPLSYALLFVAGLFTGFHCVGMCGALVVGYVVKSATDSGSKYLAHLYYGLGKLLSYTVIGGLFGALGAIVTFTPYMRGLAGIGAGVFLLLFGLSTLNLFPSLARFRIKTPDFVMKRLGQAYRSNSHPFVIGLLNGLMIICGPLQAMYILAAGTGDPMEGAKMLFVFGLGTLPMMLGFGVLASALSKQFAPKIVRASGVIVISLGIIMLNRGLAMTGGGHDYHSLLARWLPASHTTPHAPSAPTEVQVIRMSANRKGYEPSEFTLSKGVPVRWIIQGEEIDYCNHRIAVPSLNLEFDIHQGETVIEFTPSQTGVIPWSCWMGMVHGTFMVHEDVKPTTAPNPVAVPHDEGQAQGASHDLGRDDSSPARAAPSHWMRELLERSAAAIDALRRGPRP